MFGENEGRKSKYSSDRKSNVSKIFFKRKNICNILLPAKKTSSSNICINDTRLIQVILDLIVLELRKSLFPTRCKHRTVEEIFNVCNAVSAMQHNISCKLLLR